MAAFWVNTNIDNRRPLTREGWSWGGENSAGIFHKDCVCCCRVLFISWIFNQLQFNHINRTSNPLRKEWGKHNNKTGKQHPLLHIDKRQSFAAHLQFSGITNGEIQCEMLQILDTACCWNQRCREAQECDSSFPTPAAPLAGRDRNVMCPG